MKIILVLCLMIFSGYSGFAQINQVAWFVKDEIQKSDTVKSKTRRSTNTKKDSDKYLKDSDGDQTNNSNKESQAIKNVKSSRPDMSKARGARPPNIIRPAGSRIPNGIGKPAGAIRPGHG